MQFMFLILEPSEAAPAAGAGEHLAAMGRWAGELAGKGVLRGGAPLHPASQGARVSARRGKLAVTDGPFAETKEIVGGYFLVEAKDRAEAIELAKTCPAAQHLVVEVREVIPVGPPSR